jgi:hypothetical protein
MGRATVKYRYGEYSGTVEVDANPNDDNDVIYARAKKQMFRNAPPPSGLYSDSYKIVERTYDE